MNIDRTRFLVLTGMITAGVAAACTIQQTKKDEPAAQPDKTGETSGDAGNTTDTADAGAAGDGASSSDAAGDGGACLGDDGPAPDCTASKCGVQCEYLGQRFKKAIAREVLACLELDPTCEGTGCVDKVLPKACADTTAASFCTPLVTSCKDNGAQDEITQSSCEEITKALSTSGRDDFTSCITEGTSGYCTMGSSFCVDSMKF